MSDSKSVLERTSRAGADDVVVALETRPLGEQALFQVDGDDRVHRTLYGDSTALSLSLAAMALLYREQRPLDVHAR